MCKFILNQNMPDLYHHLDDEYRIAKLAYMSDIFEHLNELRDDIQDLSRDNYTKQKEKLKKRFE